MAFDGITVSALVAEIDDNLKGGRINKIAQPENDELLITGKGCKWTETSSLKCKRIPSSDLFYR